MIRYWVGVREQATVERRQSWNDMCENRIPGTEWVVGSERSGSKFYQNRVGESNRAIREQL